MRPPALHQGYSWILSLLLLLPTLTQAQNALPSWKEGPSRKAIETFVTTVITEGSKNFIPESRRIAVFDNDGTLWSEQPMFFEALFAMDEVRRLAPQHPEWSVQQPFKAVLENDHRTLAKSGTEGVIKLFAATHSGMSTDEFIARVRSWLAQAKHPRTQKPYTEMVYQPMLELLAYLRANGFKTFIVSGGEVAFMRAFAEEVYGIPPEQVIGTTFKSEFRDANNVLSIQRLPELLHIDDGAGKPVSIDTIIGQRPILAFGNSDGDLQMLQWTMAGSGTRLAGLVHHTDSKREWAYDRESDVGRLDKALDEAKRGNWTVVDMANEWSRVYPFEQN